VFWSIVAWIATSAVILATAPKTDAKFVFTVFTNETGWPDGVAWMLGLLQSAVMAKNSAISIGSLLTYSAVRIFANFTAYASPSETDRPARMKRAATDRPPSLSLIGFDAITHMTEEMPRPTRDAPIAMMMCVAIGGVTYIYHCTKRMSRSN
jgi:choline transport protein